MSRPVRPPIGAPRHNGSFTYPRRGARFCPEARDLGGKSIAGEAAPVTDTACSAPVRGASLAGAGSPSQPLAFTREATLGGLAQLCGSTRLKTSRTASRRRGGRPLTGLLGSAVLALAPAFDCLAESRIGRLFSTVEQRIELDRIRDRPAVEQATEPAASEVETEAEPRLALHDEPDSERDATSPVVTVNGLVIRSDGHRLAWVDGVEAGVEVATPGGVGIEVDRARSGSIRIRLPERGVDAELKPGQTIDVARGSVFEAYETRPVRGAAGTAGGRASEPGIADTAGAHCSDPLPIRGCEASR